jgi:hypothetical protein
MIMLEILRIMYNTTLRIDKCCYSIDIRFFIARTSTNWRHVSTTHPCLVIQRNNCSVKKTITFSLLSWALKYIVEKLLIRSVKSHCIASLSRQFMRLFINNKFTIKKTLLIVILRKT